MKSLKLPIRLGGGMRASFHVDCNQVFIAADTASVRKIDSSPVTKQIVSPSPLNSRLFSRTRNVVIVLYHLTGCIETRARSLNTTL